MKEAISEGKWGCPTVPVRWMISESDGSTYFGCPSCSAWFKADESHLGNPGESSFRCPKHCKLQMVHIYPMFLPVTKV